MITGPTGVGKTHIATAIAGDRISKLKPVYFGFMPNILERLRNFNDGQPNNFFNFLVEHPFLTKLSDENVLIVGLNYKDSDNKASEWLQKHGNTYVFSIFP